MNILATGWTERATSFDGQNQARSAEVSGRRYLSIDVLRGLAAVLMVQDHFVEHLSSDISPQDDLFTLSTLIGLTPAPIFSFLLGLSYSLWLNIQENRRLSDDSIMKYSIRRGAFLFVLGIAVNIFIWLPKETFNWDILTLLGASTIVLAFVRSWSPGAIMGVCVAVLLVAPPLRDLNHYATHWWNSDYVYDFELSQVLLGFLLNGYFPLLPWIVYPLIGFTIGRVFYVNETTKQPLSNMIIVFGASLIGISVVLYLLHPYVPGWAADYYATRVIDHFYPATTNFVLGSLGAIMLGLALLDRIIDVKQLVSPENPVLAFFRRFGVFVLTTYVVHLSLHTWPMWFAADWAGKNDPTYYYGSATTVSTALWLALAFIAIFSFCLKFLERHKKYSIEYFLRWICD